MYTIAATYNRPVYNTGGVWLYDTQIELTAECEQVIDEIVVIWTDETREKLADLGLDGEELVGCNEAITEAFWESEREECRLASVRQRLGAEEAA